MEANIIALYNIVIKLLGY